VARSTKPRNRARGRKSQPPQGLSAFITGTASAWFSDPESPGLRLVKFGIGILLVPVCWILFETFLVLLQADTLAGSYWRSREFAFFGLGAALWMVLFVFARCRAMLWLYVAGHELTHALFVVICKGRVGRVHISAKGGHILTNRNNFLISLSPYFFPFYSAVVIVAWFLYSWVVAEQYQPDPVWLYGMIGLTWMFHLTFTVWMILREQPDVEQNGRLFSFTVIFAANVLLLSGMLIVASPTATFPGFFASFWENVRTFVPRVAETAVEVLSMMAY
jgi:hypothetical protein